MELSANEIILKAMVKARVIYPGEAVMASKIAQVFDDLNGMLESWSLENLMIPADVMENFALTAGQSEYTYGSGGDFNSSRPVYLRDECFVRNAGSDYPVRLVSTEYYRKMRDKSSQTTPRIVAYNPEFPLGRIMLWPPPAESDNFYIKVAKQLDQFATTATKIDMAPGCSRAIILNLSVEICPSFGKKVPDALAALASHAKRVIKLKNSGGPVESSCSDLAMLTGTSRGGGGSIINGPFGG
jgi:hypothetical protein